MKTTHSRLVQGYGRGEAPPDSLALWTLDDDYAAGLAFGGLCSPTNLTDVRVGRYTLADYRRGDVTREELEQEVARSPAPAWERVGHYVICREERAVTSGRFGLIVGFEIPNEPLGGEPFSTNILLSDNHVRRERLDDGADFLVRDFVARAELGLDPPPADLYAHFNTTPEAIRALAASQN